MTPRPPHVPIDDDAPVGVPALDGDGEPPIETAIEIDVRDDERSALDDAAGGDAWAPPLDTQDEPSALGDEPAEPLEPDDELGEGEGERWTDGSDSAEDVAWRDDDTAEPAHSVLDRGEEGFDEAAASGDALPDLPAARAGDADDEADEALDVREASSLEVGTERAGSIALPRASVEVRFHGPTGESVRAIAIDGDDVVAAGRTLRVVAGTRTLGPMGEAEPSAVLPTATALLVGTESGDVWSIDRDGGARRLPRPGTQDASVGAVDVAAIGSAVLARTRGGALFRRSESGWVGPVVARSVRKVSASADWLALVVGSPDATELLVSSDGHTFARVGVHGIIVDASRSGDVIAIAGVDGVLRVSTDAGASFRLVDGASDVERVWVLPGGHVLAAAFHEATDHGRLLRVHDGVLDVVLDVEAEVVSRRLSTPGEHDGDGRIHALALSGQTLFVATGVGVFSIDLRRE